MAIRKYVYILTILTILVFTDTSVATTTTPPASIANLHADRYKQDYILWHWKDPSTSDFDHVEVYINGVFKADIPKGVRHYNATGLIPYTRYTISTHTVDTYGNINPRWKSYSKRTAKDNSPPDAVTDLHAESYNTDNIKWVWTDPSDIDFSKVEIYINGIYKTSVDKGIEYYIAEGLIPNTEYTIGVQTVDTSGNLGEQKNDIIKTERDYISPDSISNLHADSYGTDNIKWIWTDPQDIDLDHVEIYIDGAFKKNISKGVESYSATGLDYDTEYEIGTHTVDTSGNINEEWKNDTAKTASKSTSKEIKFVTIGDPHISDGSDRLKMAVDYINGMSNINFVVVMGDISEFSTAKNILNKLDVPYYIVAGNHDLKSGSLSSFESYFGSAKRIRNINGYQLIFVGIKGTSDEYEWDFNYNVVDKDKPTIIFNHGPVQPKPGGSCSDWGSYFGYACDMKSEVNKFTHLLAYYAGHTHVGTEQNIGDILYVTEDNLGGYGPDSDYMGYTEIHDDTVNYDLIRY